MGFNYLEDITCYTCGGHELERQPILNGFTRCTCKVCGSKFLVKCDGSDIIDRYVADRGAVLATFETAALYNKDLSEARNALGKLVNNYSAIVDIDPIYHWFKIVLLTDNFKDVGQFNEAEKEHGKVSEYFLSPEDKERSGAYEKLYGTYCDKLSNLSVRKKKKKKIGLSLGVTFIVAAIAAVFLTLCLYNPVLKDGDTNISLKLNNGAFGLFGKFSVTSSVEKVEENTSKYNVVDAAIGGLAVRYEAYEITFLKDGKAVEPTSEVSVTVPLPAGYNKECIGIYYIDNAGICEEVKGISVSSGSVTFNAKKLSLYAIAEKKLKVTFDTGDGNASDIRLLEWGNSVAEPAAPAAKFGYVFGGWYLGDKEYNFSSAVAKDLVLTAHWVRDAKYDGYTYISTAEELKNVSANTSGKFLLLNDIDLGGTEWSVVSPFKGTFDGGYHSVYNFNITSSAYYGANERVIGFFGQLLSGSTVKNLQIGKESSTTKIECAPWEQHVHAGLIAGYNSGNIINCRGVNCIISIGVGAQNEKYKDNEFASNVGGISGVVRDGTVSQCYVTKCNFTSKSESRYNNISNVARCAGIAGYTDNATINDCLIENNSIVSYAKTNDVEYNFWYTNKSGQPYAVAGSVIGHAVNTKLTRVVACGDNKLSASKSVGENSNGEGAVYLGSMMGLTNGTTPSDLIGVNTSQNCSGTNPSYPNFTRIPENSFALLTQTNNAFNNGRWTEEDGAIKLVFKE